ncbi:MAG: alpha/beta hydrolase [Halieaceae bacterium]|nr:alpha/beta hydrolase [Halieaceae bacterium]
MTRHKNLRRIPGTPQPDHYWRTPQDHIIAGDSLGDPANPAVVLLHGGGQTRHAWKGACEALADAGYHAIALDARGHGDSSWMMDGDYHFPDMGDDLAFVINTLGLVRPFLVGASMGGLVSIMAQGTGKVDARGLILVDIAPKTDREGTARIIEFMEQGQRGFDSLGDVATAIASYQPQRETRRSLDGLAKNVRIGDDGRYYWHWDPAIFKARELELDDMVADLRKMSAALDLPVLLVRGALSDVLSEEGVEDFKTLCPHTEYVNVAGAAHMVAGDRNDAFIAAILEFIGRIQADWVNA